VRIFDGERYWKGCEVASGGPEEGQLEERVRNVVELIEEVDRQPLPALGSTQREEPAAVADAYERAYDSLLAAATDD
jgi:hypothetical protein